MNQEQRFWVGEHQNSKVTREKLLEVARNHKMVDCRELNIGTNISLDAEILESVAASPYLQGLTSMTFTEVVIPVQSITRLLELPHLDSLTFSGGCSMDYGGPTNIYPTLSDEHLQALLDSPQRDRLRRLDFADQGVSSDWLLQFRAALPGLVKLVARDTDGYGATKEGTLEPP